MAVVVDQRQRRIPIVRSRLVRAVDRALAALGRPAGLVEVAVVDDAEIRRLNGRHRGIGRRTDVLAFPLEMSQAGPLVGQLVISADAAVRQARRLRVPLALELDLLATHGTLHLAGYDDRDPVEADLMHRRERDILGNRYGGDGPKLFPGVTITGWERVGNYALRFDFSDGHRTGLYSYDYLRQLAAL